MSKELTEQWKKGELSEGHYYVKDGDNMIAEYLDGYFYNNGEPMTSFSGGVDEVLDKVPSYEEYQKLLSDQLAKIEGEEINAELEAENQKLKEEVSRESYKVSEAYCFVEELKELLKECRKSISWYQEIYGAMDLDTYTLLAKLNEVLK